MSSSNADPTANNPRSTLSKDFIQAPPSLTQAVPSATPTSSNRRSSLLASLLSPITPQPPHLRHNSMSSSSGSSTISVPQSLSSATNADYGPLSGSPASSIASPSAARPSPIQGSKPNFSPGSHNTRQASLSESFSSLASSLGWPSSAATSSTQPISIPNCDPGSNIDDHHAHSALTGSSAPTRRTSIGAPSFRRAFELPNYSNLYTHNDNSYDSSAPVDPSRRGRSGSLFSSFGVGDASKRTSGPPRRKLSPMGERMIRDHPF